MGGGSQQQSGHCRGGGLASVQCMLLHLDFPLCSQPDTRPSFAFRFAMNRPHPVGKSRRGVVIRLMRLGCRGTTATAALSAGREAVGRAFAFVDLLDQVGLPGQILARGGLVAVVAVMHEEQVVDALAVGRFGGR
ncbi:hypothetical protein D3C71_1236050 [compost metagenome]